MEGDQPYLSEVHARCERLWGFIHTRTDWLDRELRLLRDCIEDERVWALRDARVEREITPGFMAIAALCVLRDAQDQGYRFYAGPYELASFAFAGNVEPDLPFVSNKPARLVFFLPTGAGYQNRLVIQFDDVPQITDRVRNQYVGTGIPLLHVHAAMVGSLSTFSLLVSDSVLG